VFWIVAVSWGSGKSLILGVPPDDVAHATAPPQFPADVLAQYLGTPAAKVIPELPLQLPSLVPDAGAAAPAIVMSLKSTSVKDTAPQVRVRVEVSELDLIKVLQVASVPAETVKVPVIV